MYRATADLRILDSTSKTGLDRIELDARVLVGKIVNVESLTGAIWVKWKGLGADWRYTELGDVHATREDAIAEARACYDRTLRLLKQRWDQELATGLEELEVEK